jgi:hypothetical protein
MKRNIRYNERKYANMRERTKEAFELNSFCTLSYTHSPPILPSPPSSTPSLLTLLPPPCLHLYPLPPPSSPTLSLLLHLPTSIFLPPLTPGYGPKKPGKVQMSNWALRDLSPQQVQYAAYDALMGKDIYDFLDAKCT